MKFTALLSVKLFVYNVNACVQACGCSCLQSLVWIQSSAHTQLRMDRSTTYSENAHVGARLPSERKVRNYSSKTRDRKRMFPCDGVLLMSGSLSWYVQCLFLGMHCDFRVAGE